MADNKQIKDGLGNLFTLRSRDVSLGQDGSLMRSMFYATPYPADYGGDGIYQRCDTSGVFLTGLSPAAPVYSFSWPSASTFAAISRLRISAWSTSTAFASSAIGSFSIIGARQFTVQDSNGISDYFADGSNRLRGSMGLADANIVIANNGALLPGTRQLDSAPLDSRIINIPATANTPFTATPLTLFEKLAGEHPLILAAQDGFVVTANIPGDGSWQFAVTLEWAELPNY